MDMNAINRVNNTTPTATPATNKKVEEVATEETKKNTATDTGVIYEKSNDDYTVLSKDNAAIVAKLKADAEARTAQLRSLVEQMMTKQGQTIATADDMWKFLAKGDYEVSPDVKAQAQADIAEDGYWGVEQTSDRIIDFAKALSNNNPEKADLMIEAFKEGYKQAEEAWGGELPEISKQTYDAVLEKFEAWKAEATASGQA